MATVGGVYVTLNIPMAKAKIEKAIDAATPKVTRAFVEDANQLAPVLTGALRASALTESKWDEGIAVWDTAYAKRRYFTGSQTGELMWAEANARRNGKKYAQMYTDALKG